MKLLDMTVKEFFTIFLLFFVFILGVAGCVETLDVGISDTSVTGKIEQLVPIPLNASYYAVLIHFDDGRIVNFVMRDSDTFEFWRGKSVKISFDRYGIINSVQKVQ